MSYDKCPICKELDFLDRHKCKPIYFFTHEYWGERQEIRATSFEDAALAFARLYNGNGDYNLMNSEEEVVISDGKTEKKFIVSAEPDIAYNAKEIE